MQTSRPTVSNVPPLRPRKLNLESSYRFGSTSEDSLACALIGVKSANAMAANTATRRAFRRLVTRGVAVTGIELVSPLGGARYQIHNVCWAMLPDSSANASDGRSIGSLGPNSLIFNGLWRV